MAAQSNSKKTVITYGTFDLFHVGHVRLLERVSKLGTKLIVGVSNDEFNAKKGKFSVFPYEQRAEIVSSLGCVDMVFEEETWDQKVDDIKKYEAAIFAMGSDWEGKFDELKEHCAVQYLPRTEGISSADIKIMLHNDYGIDPEGMKKQFEILKLVLSDMR
jgi:glycerol-3-phosphate cytidylyltransferase